MEHQTKPSDVSVVIPTFNRPRATARAVASALGQTLPPKEVIVVDDASEPPLSLGAFGIEDPRLRLVTLAANSGASAARQAGVEAASGTFVAFLDSDDRWLPGKLAAQVALIEDSGSSLVAVSCGWREEGERGLERIPAASTDPLDFASGCWFCPGSTVILPRHAFDIVGPFDPGLRRLEDLDWFLRFGMEGGRLEVSTAIGAVISIGRRGRTAEVAAACTRILGRHQKLPAKARRALTAYLNLECAAAARNDARYVPMLNYLARSFLALPRLRLPLRRWW